MLRVALPPLAEQKAIAAVLGALDDKIELNRRMNATLEAMARALFQSWFVDFDPVRAKLDGRQPAGLDPATAALFPNEFEDSTLGPIPKGWTVAAICDKIQLLSGGTPKTSEPSPKTSEIVGRPDLVFGFSREVINFGLMRAPVGAVSPVYEVFKIDSSKIEPDPCSNASSRFNMP